MAERKERLKTRIKAALAEKLTAGSVDEVAYVFVGPGLLPFVIGGAVLAALVSMVGYRTGVELGIWGTLLYGLVVGGAYLVWLLVARPHFAVLSGGELVLVRSAFWSVRPETVSRREPLADLRPAGFKPGWAWGRLDVASGDRERFRINFPRAWRPEVERIRDALGGGRPSAAG